MPYYYKYDVKKKAEGMPTPRIFLAHAIRHQSYLLLYFFCSNDATKLASPPYLLEHRRHRESVEQLLCPLRVVYITILEPEGRWTMLVHYRL